MRSLLNIVIMGFVVYAVWYQVKSNNFPELSQYFAGASSSFKELKASLPDSLKNIFAPLNNIAGTMSGNGGGGPVTDLTAVSDTNNVNFNSLGKILSPITDVFKVPATATNGTTPSLPNSLVPSIQKIITPEKIEKLPATSTGTNTSSGTSTASPYLSISGIIQNTNKERAANSAGALTESSTLDASAAFKAKDILARQYFEHLSPDGKLVSDLVTAQGYVYIKIGENLALGNFGSDEAVVTAWMNSPGHRANILDASFTEIGIGIAYGMYQGREVSVAVQHFGRPRSSCPPISTSLKKQVEDGQKALDAMIASLNSLRAEIDQGKANGDDVNGKITLYNNGVEKYESEYARVDALRGTYNTQVGAFNSCLATANGK